MNRFCRHVLVVASAVALLAPAPLAFADQDASTVKPDPPAAPGGDRLTPSELEELLGPIALYPDALLANVLAAAVYPDEVAEAAAAVKGGASASQIDSKTWEAPVKAVAKVPDAMKMLGEYPDWTTALGQAYLIQAKDVMDTVQTLRKKANDNGALQSTPQQTVTTEAQTIYIQSPDPEVIYVPSYQPSVVYVDDDDDDVVAAGVIGFGVGVATGLILSDVCCDWHGGCVGWGGGHNDIDVDINRGDINTGDINVGNNVGNGNRPRPGQEGNAWKPNQNKATAANRPSQSQSFRNTAAGQGQGRFPASTTSNWSQGTGTRRPTAGTRDASPAGAQNRSAAQQRPTSQQRPASASKVPANRPPSAVPSDRGGSGAGSRQTGAGGSGGASNRSSGGRSTSGGGGSRGGSNSAYSGGSGTRQASQRGSASRGGGGGGSRGGGGGRGGGGRR